MPDSHHYETGYVLHGEYNGKGDDAWDLIRKIQVFLNDVVGNGWTKEYATGDGPGDDSNAEDQFYFDALYDPGKLHEEHMLGDHVHGSAGKCLFVETNKPWSAYSGNNTAKAQARCKTAYFKYSDGVERDSEFFISIIEDFALSGLFYNSEYRIGALNLPREDTMYLGGFLGHGISGGGGYPVAWNSGEYNVSVCNLPEDPPVPDYITNTCIGQTPTTVGAPYGSSPWNYQTQPGYVGEARCNMMEWLPSSTQDEPVMKYHFFGGVENGAPYFYCIMEGLEVDSTQQQRQRSFAHFGFGRVAKIGDYDGGEFYVATGWSTNTIYAASPTSNQHCNMFDGKDTRYASNRSSFLFNNSRTVLDDQDNSTLLDNYLFGYSYNNHQKRVYGDTTSGLITPLLNDGAKSDFSFKTELFRNYIRVYDIARDDGTYMFVGIPPAYRTVKIPNVQPEQQYTDRDGHTWMIFPLRGKYNDSVAKPSSGDYGLAYRIS